ncbi:hypothetical protein GCM10029992_15900 [Glycomyces albus]
MSQRLRPVSPIWVAGRPQHGEEEFFVSHPYDDSPVGATSWATAGQVEAAVAAAAGAAAESAALPAHVRAEALEHVRRRLDEEAETSAELITAESGKPIAWARVEVDRAVSTFRWAAEEARRFTGRCSGSTPTRTPRAAWRSSGASRAGRSWASRRSTSR